jgi:hypothetical protein
MNNFEIDPISEANIDNICKIIDSLDIEQIKKLDPNLLNKYYMEKCSCGQCDRFVEISFLDRLFHIYPDYLAEYEHNDKKVELIKQLFECNYLDNSILTDRFICTFFENCSLDDESILCDIILDNIDKERLKNIKNDEGKPLLMMFKYADEINHFICDLLDYGCNPFEIYEGEPIFQYYKDYPEIYQKCLEKGCGSM